jgi:carboxyl-terminal processing protease
MTGFFMDRGPVVQVKNTLSQVQVKDSENGRPIYGGPLIVMTDKSSASASEILAGALQDYNRAVIVGESSTFGKGTVQQPMDIGRMLPLFSVRNRAGYLKVTIQKFYRPSGSSTQMDGVASDLVLPSLMDAMEMGEAYLDHSLPHDRIRRAPDFKPLDPQGLFIPRLKELSQKRVNACKDFGYIIEDVMKAKDRLAKNRVRFADIAKQDKETFRFFKITLDDIETAAALKPYDPSDESASFMRRAKDETEDLDETPKWPTGLDPVKRESLAVLGDLVELSENARLAGMVR